MTLLVNGRNIIKTPEIIRTVIIVAVITYYLLFHYLLYILFTVLSGLLCLFSLIKTRNI